MFMDCGMMLESAPVESGSARRARSGSDGENAKGPGPATWHLELCTRVRLVHEHCSENATCTRGCAIFQMECESCIQHLFGHGSTSECGDSTIPALSVKYAYM